MKKRRKRGNKNVETGRNMWRESGEEQSEAFKVQSRLHSEFEDLLGYIRSPPKKKEVCTFVPFGKNLKMETPYKRMI